MKLLVAESNAENRHRLGGLLQADGHRVVEVDDVEQVLPAFIREAPDMVLIGCDLGDSGTALAQQIKHQSQHRFVPVVFTTPMTDEHELEEIAAEINRKLYRTLPAGHFCSTSLIAVDFEKSQLRFWNGGLP